MSDYLEHESDYLERVSMVKTKDGTLYESEKLADAYIVDDICSNINDVLKLKQFDSLRYSDLTKIIELLSGNIQNAKRLKAILDKHF